MRPEFLKHERGPLRGIQPNEMTLKVTQIFLHEDVQCLMFFNPKENGKHSCVKQNNSGVNLGLISCR